MRIVMLERTEQIQRSGLAPLEFVLLMPLLVGLSYLLFSLARTSLTGFEQIEAARRTAFTERDSIRTGAPLLRRLPLERGQVEHRAEAVVSLTSNWLRDPFTVESFSRTLAGTWDSTEVRFKRQRAPMNLHTSELKTVAHESRVQGVVGQQGILARLLRFEQNYAVSFQGSVVRIFHAILLINDPLLFATKPTLNPIRWALTGFEFLARATLQFDTARRFARWRRAVEYGQRGCEQLRRARQGHRVEWAHFDPWDAGL